MGLEDLDQLGLDAGERVGPFQRRIGNDQIIFDAAPCLLVTDAAGVDVLLDDRDERPGVKFKDADLLGFPFRITVGKRYTENGMIEVRRRKDGFVEETTLDELLNLVKAHLTGETTAI